MKKLLIISIALFFVILFPKGLLADDEKVEELENIRLKTDFNIWKVNLKRTDWLNDYQKLSWNGFDVVLPEYIEDELYKQTSGYIEETIVKDVDYEEVKDYLERSVAPEINREKQDVTIGLDEDGKIAFDGFAMSGQKIDYKRAFYVIKEAFAQKEADIRLPIEKIPPVVNVQDEELTNKGIVALISTGETDFSGSPYNRRNNIRVGLRRFNGYIIPPGGKSGAGKILGSVTEKTGYLPELVIKGDKTIPEYGGGLCQVSTTVYRSILFGGFPILERKNHSYAVSYYDPQGLDATIYPPSPDLKFMNDTENHILLQATTIGSKAYVNTYGTPVERHVDLIGPWYYDYRRAPPPRTEHTKELPAGEKQIVGGAHAGFTASWYRRISYADEEKEDEIEHIYSKYEARPLYTLIGEGKEEVPDNSGVPDRR